MNERPSVFRILTACLVVTVGVALASIAPARNRRNPGADPARFTVERKTPAAVARHMKRFESLPGLEGMNPEGPGSADAEQFLARAYPDDDIPLARLDAARAAAARLKGKAFPQRQGAAGHVGDRRSEQRALPVHAVPQLVRLRAERTTWRADARPLSPSIRTARTGTAACGCSPPAAACGGPRTR